MPSVKAQEEKLPRWAKNIIATLRYEIKKLQYEREQARKAHAVLFEFGDWFTIHGPPADAVIGDDGYSLGGYSLFFCGPSGTHPACTLRVGDVLLVGRRQRTVRMNDREQCKQLSD